MSTDDTRSIDGTEPMNGTEPNEVSQPTAGRDATAPSAPSERRAANPASRARRIGGRPSPTPASRPSPRPGSVPESAPAEAAPASAVSRTAAPEPASPEPAAPEPAHPVSVVKAEPGALEADGGERADAGRTRRAALRWVPAGVLGAAALVLAVVVAVAAHGVYWGKKQDAPTFSLADQRVAQERVLAAAKKCFAQVNTYDYRKLDGLVATDLACTTGKFTSIMRTALQRTILAQAPAAKAVQTAQVNRAGVVAVSSDGAQWTVLIFGQLTQTNTSTGSTPRIDLFGAVVTMDRVGGDYKIAAADFDTGNPSG